MDGVIDRLEWYEEILKAESTSSLFADLAELLYEDGRFEEAVEVCQKGLIAHPYHLKGELYLGLALLALGKKKDAFESLKAVEGKIRIYARLFEALAVIHKENGNNEEADRLITLATLIGATGKQKISSAMLKSLPPEQEPVEPENLVKKRLGRMIEIVEKKLQFGIQEIPYFCILDEEEQKIIETYVTNRFLVVLSNDY
jgi:tetratricopeptide (TPR) repeat protein